MFWNLLDKTLKFGGLINFIITITPCERITRLSHKQRILCREIETLIFVILSIYLRDKPLSNKWHK